MSTFNTTVGADPELFLQEESGKFISSIGKIGGSKANPKDMYPTVATGFAVQEDNVAVEFNIPPAFSQGEFIRNIALGLDYLTKQATRLKLKLAIIPAAEFTEDQLQDPAAKEFGCEPDYNVWRLQDNPRPACDNPFLRSAGGHVHIGTEIKDKIGLGRAADLFLGCPSIVFDADQQRRLLYGRAGSIRDKPYGIEYRTLSNFWIRSPEMIGMIWDQVQQMLEFVRSERPIPTADGRKIIDCINNSNMDALRDLTKTYGLKY